MDVAKIGVIGGSGFYSLIEGAEERNIDTEFGNPSDMVSIAEISGKKVAFVPRHGRRHSLPPHKVPYKANIEALRKLGVERIISVAAIGSLNKHYAPGDLVIFDQYANMTSGRDDTFFHSGKAVHISQAEPYCKEMRALASASASSAGLKFHDSGSVVVINGPRFSTKAESKFYGSQGFDTINMTQYPEVTLAREREICYLGIGIVTDYDVGLEAESGIKPVSAKEVSETFAKNIDKVKKLTVEIISRLPEKRTCECAAALSSAMM